MCCLLHCRCPPSSNTSPGGGGSSQPPPASTPTQVPLACPQCRRATRPLSQSVGGPAGPTAAAAATAAAAGESSSEQQQQQQQPVLASVSTPAAPHSTQAGGSSTPTEEQQQEEEEEEEGPLVGAQHNKPRRPGKPKPPPPPGSGSDSRSGSISDRPCDAYSFNGPYISGAASGSLTVTRVLTSVVPSKEGRLPFTAQGAADPGSQFDVMVAPASMRLRGGESQKVTITVKPRAGTPPSVYQFGEVSSCSCLAQLAGIANTPHNSRSEQSEPHNQPNRVVFRGQGRPQMSISLAR